MGGPFFDRIAVVDWSANATPKTGPDSIWIAVVDLAEGFDVSARPDVSARLNASVGSEATAGLNESVGSEATAGGVLSLTNPSTRREAIGEMSRLAEPGRRTLLGVDFSLGYPAGTAAACGLTGTAWPAMWGHLGAEIVDDERNRNNRFHVASRLNAAMGDAPGPFWGCPPSRTSAALTATKPDRAATWPDEWRSVESELRGARHRPFSAWQLLGAGSVGGQSLVGIAALERLRRTLGDRLAVWPFTTGLGPPVFDLPAGDTIELVVAEVWPSLWEVTVPAGVVKDAAQVESTARRLAALDAAGALEEMFRVELDAEAALVVTEEEGWVLGVAGSRS
jgi:hypothetical protein